MRPIADRDGEVEALLALLVGDVDVDAVEPRLERRLREAKIQYNSMYNIILTIIKRDVWAGYFRNSDRNNSDRIGTITENFTQPQR